MAGIANDPGTSGGDDGTGGADPAPPTGQEGSEALDAVVGSEEAPTSPSDAYELSDHAKNFYGEMVNEFPEELHPKLDQVIKRWDAGANLKFTEYQDKLKPYEELGQVEDLQRALAIVEQIRTNPAGFRDLLNERLGDQRPNAAPAVSDDDDPYAAQFETYRTEQQQFQNGVIEVMNAMAQELAELKSVGTQGAADAEFEKKMSLVKVANPDIDESAVKTLVERGFPIDEAVTFVNSNIQSVKNQLGKQPPAGPTLPGSGTPPSRNVTPGDLSDEEADSLVTQALQQMYGQT